MKQFKKNLMVLLVLSASLTANAQTTVSGTNLNIETYSQYANTLDGGRGNAIGMSHWLGGYHSLAAGNNDTILNNANSSIAFGSMNRVGGVMSIAIGSNVKIGNSFSIGIGNNLNLTGNTNCMAIGNGIIGSGNNPDVFLENSHNNSLVVGFHSTKPTLTVGPSPNDYPQGDTIGKTGKVAIGDVPVPDIAAKLHIRSDYGEDAGIILEPKDPSTENTFIMMRDEKHGVEVDKDGVMILKSLTTNTYNGSDVKKPLVLNGIVGINISPNRYDDLTDTYGLWVREGILTDRIIIKRQVDWFDCVFAPDYELMPLWQLKEYVSEKRHLPDIPSEKEVVDNGVEVYEMQSLLLKKIEELTLYTIQLQEQIESMQTEINALKNK
jgi:hypothetical protein